MSKYVLHCYKYIVRLRPNKHYLLPKQSAAGGLVWQKNGRGCSITCNLSRISKAN